MVVVCFCFLFLYLFCMLFTWNSIMFSIVMGCYIKYVTKFPFNWKLTVCQDVYHILFTHVLMDVVSYSCIISACTMRKKSITLNSTVCSFQVSRREVIESYGTSSTVPATFYSFTHRAQEFFFLCIPIKICSILLPW